MTVMEMMASLVYAQSQVARLESVLGVTADEAATVLAVAAGKRPCSLADLSHWLDLPRPRVARLVRTLVRRGWAEVLPDPANRRRVRVRLTQGGFSYLHSLPPTAAAALAPVAQKAAGHEE